MKIAMLSPPWIKVPPAGYGGIEWVVYYLTNELVARGHDVTLFATGDSVTDAHLEAVFDIQMPERIGETMIDVRHVAACLNRADDFDIIHDHSGYAAVAFASLIDTPVVHTLHGPFTEDTRAFYRSFKDAAHYVAISKYQMGCCPDINYAGVVYNPIDTGHWPIIETEEREDYLLAFGRICPDKGFHAAIAAARRAGMKLIIAGAVQEFCRDYFETVISPEIDGESIQFVGEVSLTEKWNLFSKARAFLFPVQWPEPFGLVMIEAMAAGTPVIAFPEGSVPEIVKDGVTGFIVKDIDEMVQRLGDLDEIKAEACRKYVEDNFSVSRITEGYLDIFERVANQPFLAGGEAAGL
jgi:glycosyltransferase involved in cell wall biosynthesis